MRQSIGRIHKKCGKDEWYIRKDGRADCAFCINMYKAVNKSEINKRRAEFRLEHKDEINDYNHLYYKENRKSELVRAKAYRDEHPELYKTHARNRRALKRLVNENFTTEHIRITRMVFKDRCFNCKSTGKLHLDHHLPLSKGNALTLSNAVLLCVACNGRKKTKLPSVFYSPAKLKQVERLLCKAAKLGAKIGLI
jgi:5-methylcytosine-specific restriction endonuclease McrA